MSIEGIEAIRARFQAGLVPAKEGFDVKGRLKGSKQLPQSFTNALRAEIAYQGGSRAVRPKPADGHNLDRVDPSLVDRVANLIGIIDGTGTDSVSAGIRQKGKVRLVEVAVNTGTLQKLYAPLEAVRQALAQRAYASSAIKQLLSQLQAKGSA